MKLLVIEEQRMKGWRDWAREIDRDKDGKYAGYGGWVYCRAGEKERVREHLADIAERYAACGRHFMGEEREAELRDGTRLKYLSPYSRQA